MPGMPPAATEDDDEQQQHPAADMSPGEGDGTPPVSQPDDTPEEGMEGAASPVPRTNSEPPSLTITDVSAAEADGMLTFTVRRSRASGVAVTVRYATEGGTATSGSDYGRTTGTLTFPADSTATQSIEVAVLDDALDEEPETFTVRLSEAAGATLAGDAATGTIIDDDQRAITVRPAALIVPEGGRGSYAVALGSRPSATVTVAVAPAADLSAAPNTLVFEPEAWRTALMVTVTADQDDDSAADVPAELLHTVSGGDYAGMPAAPVVVTIVEDDVSSLAVAVARVAEHAGVLRFRVSLSLASDAAVTVRYRTGAAHDTATAGTDYTPASGILRFPAGSTAARIIEVTVADDALNEPDEALTLTLSDPQHAVLAGGGTAATATGTIEDDDEPPELSIAGANMSEGDGGMRFVVTLDRASARTVTVRYASADYTATAGADYTPVGGTLTFAAGTTARTIAVPIADDTLDEPEAEEFTVTLSTALHGTVAAGGGRATGIIRDDDDPPRARIADASLGESAESMRFTVTLDAASGRLVTMAYYTTDGTATAGTDYVQASGTLAFAVRTTEHTIAVPVSDDGWDEDSETFTVTLGDARHATLAVATATGTITDDDTRGVRVEPAELTLDTGSAAGHYTVALTSQPTAVVTVQVTASPADAVVSVTPARLTFAGTDWKAVRTVTVTAAETAMAGAAATVGHTVSGGDYQGAPAASVTVTIAEPPPLGLASLQVSGGAAMMYPDFATDVHHYATRCKDGGTAQVTAQAARGSAQLTLLRAAPGDDHVSSTGNLEVDVVVNEDHDLAVEVSDTDGAVTYVVHCLPFLFPDIRILNKTADVSDDLLLVAPKGGYVAILDNNGVPRYHREANGRIFQRHPDGPTIDGRQVRYSVMIDDGKDDEAELLDDELEKIRTVRTVAPLTSTDHHDFAITEDGHLLFVSFPATTRDYSAYLDDDGNPYSSEEDVKDSVIQEVSTAGTERFRWNSWDYVKLDPDCRRGAFTGDYAHLNSLQAIDGDIVASLPGCNQVVRIDRSAGTGALTWKLGGTTPTRDPDTEHLEIVDDPLGEFCGQHHVTLTDSDTVLMYDNGSNCVGDRKNRTAISRVVEYDISSGTQAAFAREYRHPNGVFTRNTGGVSLLDNGHWLIAWGLPGDVKDGVISVSEVDPETGTAHFEMLINEHPFSSKPRMTYRAYRASGVTIPLNLP